MSKLESTQLPTTLYFILETRREAYFFKDLGAKVVTHKIEPGGVV
jgi:hypothetical protein